MTIDLNTPIEDLNRINKDTLMEQLHIEYLEIAEGFVKARMPVNERTRQPYGILHGGASVTLAETMGSSGAFICINPAQKRPVGLEINANHVRSVRSGYVFGVARPIHMGSSTHIWEIKIHDEQERLVCVSRLTLAILDVK